ncbi:hypothetical protein [Neorhizobium galegae]|nr:hypothetical protein [Neorhizobium galegae]
MPHEISDAISAGITKFYRDCEPISDDKGLRFFLKISPQDFMEKAILKSVRDNSYICSPGGTVLKFDIRLMENFTDAWELSVSDLEDTEKLFEWSVMTPQIFKYMYKLFDYPHGEFERDYHSTTTNAEQKAPIDFAEDLLLLYTHQLVPLYYERVGYTINLSAYDYLKPLEYIELEEFEHLAKMLRPFEGWSLCVPEAFFRDSWAEELRKQVRAEPNERSVTGRPAKLKLDTLEAYRRLYPNGSNGESWPRVLRKVNQATGHNVSLDTLRRAVKAIGLSTAKQIENGGKTDRKSTA